ncbi:aspartyl-phosphate phosphatase Spo0E family protein [Oceanobacillus profundus]|uniref:Aspartyl-phosphate phosphatase Spo0E family protein n=1 Tax=Oceanobacillus profundus TaxID=372463 RepID=A0A417YKR1_9BACI|nr:aspartyl-phosphate phosphatase Spo0E family protein [Oceanobacillus profundus]MBR3120030.1 aspartyl-phosphate phosphatase Spo0E family protein [Oceanobacillus sp.]PAE30164.1 Spo0E family sporulation regulatory protein-aspartic acid phosphatase [Paenibacillus sp. 7884-2]MCM3397039.1 aspartyl-phosphate phosphatase Spo0E family protein [Oceanobacillus profundus]MDO6449815.1 aspartyl-phosphate phosphatase Spo0E family protein [Oceanobacillus profundus]RHW33812.1 aspartyl-phosphate phosphatase S
MESTENILSRIEFLRKKMTDVALKKGFTDNESVYISQELDRLLNLYEKVKQETTSTKS